MPDPDELDEIGDVLKLILQQDNFNANDGDFFEDTDLPPEEAFEIDKENGNDDGIKDEGGDDTSNQDGDSKGIPISSVSVDNILGMLLSFNPAVGPIFKNPKKGTYGSIGEGGEGSPRWTYKGADYSYDKNWTTLFTDLMSQQFGGPGYGSKKLLNSADYVRDNPKTKVNEGKGVGGIQLQPFCAAGLAYAYRELAKKQGWIGELSSKADNQIYRTANSQKTVYGTARKTGSDLIVFCFRKSSKRVGCSEVNSPVGEYGLGAKTDAMLDKLSTFQGAIFAWGAGGKLKDGKMTGEGAGSGHVGYVLYVDKEKGWLYTLEMNCSVSAGDNSGTGRMLSFKIRKNLKTGVPTRGGGYALGIVNTGALRGGAYAPKGIGNSDYLEQLYGIKMTDFDGPIRKELAAPTGQPTGQESNNNNVNEDNVAQENKSFQENINEMDCNEYAAMYMELKANPGLKVFMMGVSSENDETTGDSDKDVFTDKCRECENEVKAADPSINK
tara:strand:+ start:1610 stop:3100 length:1491 start_codon:yes stop_codon:yes gene_type:complete